MSLLTQYPGHDHGECSLLALRMGAKENITEFCEERRTAIIGEQVINVHMILIKSTTNSSSIIRVFTATCLMN